MFYFKKVIKIFLLIIVFLIVNFFDVYAADTPNIQGGGADTTSVQGGGPLTNPIGTGAKVTMPNPMGDGDVLTPSQLIGRVISIALGVVGSFALALFTYAGLLWMSAAGSPERIDKAKNVMIWAAIGMTIIFTAYAIVVTILGTVS